MRPQEQRNGRAGDGPGSHRGRPKGTQGGIEAGLEDATQVAALTREVVGGDFHRS